MAALRNVTRYFRFSLQLQSKPNNRIHPRSFIQLIQKRNYLLLNQVCSGTSFDLPRISNISYSTGKEMASLSPLDPSSYSAPDLVTIKHISLQLGVDFKEKVLTGTALLHFDVLKSIKEVVLDVKDQTIESVEFKDGTQLQYTIDGLVADFGSKLTIKLPKEYAANDDLVIKITYRTSPNASALQWLEPSQTSGKKAPYLFSQCQPIHARSILPCQDTPAVKFTYEAEVTAPKEFTVLMSAIRNDSTDNVTRFSQPVPIPSYLLAIAVGVLQSRRLGPRSMVWSEQEEIERSAWEFAETEKYLQAAENIVGPYVWTQYDLLVLPASFPYGGMENPCLTFVTPTLLAGDRSLADVLVHEIMHSWTGNLVTNRNFEHFWLNEGFTVFLERKVAASLIEDPEQSKKSRDFHSLLGLKELKETIKLLGESNPLTQLVTNLTGVHPDDSFSRVPYDKGALFLYYVEDLLGGPEVFDEFLRLYLQKFQKKSLDTDQFVSYLNQYFKGNERLKEINWDQWLHAPGMPPVIPNYDTSMTKAINDLIPKLQEGDNISSSVFEVATKFTPHQMIHFLQEVLDIPPMALPKLRDFGQQLKLNTSKNAEIEYRWLRLCVKSKDDTKLNDVFNFVNSLGRMKYVRPIYRELYAWEEIRQKAIENFLKNEHNMMHVSAYTIRKDLHLRDSDSMAA